MDAVWGMSENSIVFWVRQGLGLARSAPIRMQTLRQFFEYNETNFTDKENIDNEHLTHVFVTYT